MSLAEITQITDVESDQKVKQLLNQLTSILFHFSQYFMSHLCPNHTIRPDRVVLFVWISKNFELNDQTQKWATLDSDDPIRKKQQKVL